MNNFNWLPSQADLYDVLPNNPSQLSTHPVSGEWQTSNYLKNQYWWGGGATQESYQQLIDCDDPALSQIGIITFGPVQSFLGSGQRLRDWAVASWLCHYLSGVLIYQWEQRGGRVLLPLHRTVPLVQWLNGEDLNGEDCEERFWQAELPNIITGLFPNEQGWLEQIQQVVVREWERLLQELEQASIQFERRYLNGIGWRVIHENHRYLWSVYTASTPLNLPTLDHDLRTLYQNIESQKISRHWQGQWWGGKTSPSAGYLSQWHPGLKPVASGGLWGLPEDSINQWWENAAKESSLSGLFSKSDRLNSLEFVKRLASVPDIIQPTLRQLWEMSPPPCPWGKFPDRTAIAAAWIPSQLETPRKWNSQVGTLNDLNELFYSQNLQTAWGMPRVDKNPQQFAHPRALERRNIVDEYVADWEDFRPQGWESTIEWTVGWRGDGDKMGEWLSGEQYAQKRLKWAQWHPDANLIQQHQLNIQPPQVPNRSRQLDLPHILDLSVLFSYWNKLLYPLTEKKHDGKVIFAGGDDFLLLGPLTEVIPLTSDLHHLWMGQPTPLTTPIDDNSDGWVNYQGQTYPIPGKQMSFSLGVVIAQRRIPQSLWHRGLNDAYKQAKNQGRNRVCVRVLFNSGQSLEWVCPWPLWHCLMKVEPIETAPSPLNVWEKLLAYLESTHFSWDSSPSQASKLLDTLWQSVGLPLSWQKIQTLLNQQSDRRNLNQVVGSWTWWQNWISLRAFLARQQREREKWLEKLN